MAGSGSKFPYLCVVLPSILGCYGQLTEIRSCSENGSRTDVTQFAEYSRLELCCFLGKVDCTEATQGGGNLMLLPQKDSQCAVGDSLSAGGNCSRFSQRLADCSVKYVFSNASLVTEGNYFCSLDGNVKFTATVAILEKPVPVVIVSFSFSVQSRHIVVQFDPGPRVIKYHDGYDVRLVRVANSSDRFVMCNETSIVCPVSGQTTCSCTYQASNRILPKTDSVMVVVAVTRSLIQVQTAANFTIATHIIPGPIMRMKMVETGPHSGTLQFCMNQATTAMYRFMSKNQAYLIFHLWVLTTQDVLEILNVTFTVVAPVSVVDGSDYKCLRVNLPGLTAFTNYTAIVSASGGGGMGQKSKVDFTTGMTVPEYSPVIEDFDFSRLDKVDTNGSTYSVLAIWWQPLPHAAVGGSHLSYHVEVLSSSGAVLLNQSSQDTLVIIRNQSLPSTSISATITAQNELGSAPQYSRLVIPQKRDYVVPYVIAELNGDTALVYVNQTDLAKDTMLSIHWCRDFIDDHIYGFPVCQVYPQFANFSVKDKSQKIQKFEVLLTSKKNQPEEIDSRALNYSYYCYFDQLARKKGIANATVTRYPSEPLDDMLNSDFYVDSFDESLDTNYYYDFYWRKKRDIDDVITWYREDKLSRRKLLDYEISSDFLGSQDIRLFWSLRTEGTSGWNTGLVPLNCYFDKTKGAGKLIVSYSKEGHFVILSWNQECRMDSPAQFLADYFVVFLSSVGDCATDRQLQAKVNNSVFESNTLRLPGDVKFVCIQTCRNLDNGETECSITPTVTAINALIEFKPSYNPNIVLVVSIVVPGVIIVCGIILCLYKCWKRGSSMNYLHDRLQITSREVRDEQFGSTEDITDLNRTVVQQTSVDSFDSGRGTDTENAQDIPCLEIEVENSTQMCRPVEHSNLGCSNTPLAGSMIASNQGSEEVAANDDNSSGSGFKPTRSTDLSSPPAAGGSDSPGSNCTGSQLSSAQESRSHSTNSHPSDHHSSEPRSSLAHRLKASNLIFCNSDSDSSDSQESDSPGPHTHFHDFGSSLAHGSQSPSASSPSSAAGVTQRTTTSVLFHNTASSSSGSSESGASNSHSSESHSSTSHSSTSHSSSLPSFRTHHLDSSPSGSIKV